MTATLHRYVELHLAKSIAKHVVNYSFLAGAIDVIISLEKTLDSIYRKTCYGICWFDTKWNEMS